MKILRESLTEKETDMAFDIRGTCRLRVNAAEERLGCTVVARILPSHILSMDDLKFRAKDVFQRMCLEVNGLILVTGPTGSGKTTTLAAMLDYINSQRNEHMITIEDPIEFVHTPKKSKIMQRELRTNTLTFYNALRSALRQDPDIILVGELRDQETTALALEAAETGHLVFGTLHTNSASKTIDRIINMFSAEDQAKVRVNLAENLKGIIAQQLVKKVGGGRVVVQEIMLRNTAIAALIRDGKTYQINEYIQTAKNMGMQTMDEAIRLALEQGENKSGKCIYRYALNKADFTYTKELEAFEKVKLINQYYSSSQLSESSPQSSSVITELLSCIVSRSLLELASAVVSVELWVLCDDCNSESNSSVGGVPHYPHYLSKFLSEV